MEGGRKRELDRQTERQADTERDRNPETITIYLFVCLVCLST